jgi:hypothetical protein
MVEEMEMDQQSHDQTVDVIDTFKLDDSAIAGLLQLFQLSFLTGTDITDHLRSVELQRTTTPHIDFPRLAMSGRFIKATELFVEQMTHRFDEIERSQDTLNSSMR